MLGRLRITNFKSFAAAEVPLAPLTVLVGLNGSGKSNLLDAVRLLKGLASGFSLYSTLDGEVRGGVNVWPGIRGGTNEVVRHGEELATIVSSWSIGASTFEHELAFKANDGSGAIDHERVGVGESTLLETRWIDDPPEPELEYVSFRGKLGTPGDYSRSELSYPFPVKGSIGESTERLAPLREALTNTLFLDVKPELMRGWVARAAPGIGAAGEAVSAVLARRVDQPERKAAIEDWVSELLGGEARSLEILRTPTGEVMFALVDGAGARVTARAVSDGTLRFLGEIVALEELAPGRTLFVEEPEQGLHPARVHLLMQKLEAETATGTKQVVVTTHSPQFLDWLSRDRWDGVLLVARDPATHASIVQRVVDLPGFAELPKDQLLGELLASGWLEQAL